MTTTRQGEALTVGQVADRFGVTVRTLHHYDEIGLLSPSERSSAGYRLYSDEDLVRLATVVTHRRLGLSLDEVGAIMRGEGTPVEHLHRQRDAVMARIGELHELVDAIDAALEAEMNDRPATTKDLKRIFGHAYKDEWQQEAEERWGDTDAWRQSQERSATRTPAEWQEIKDESEQLEAALADAAHRGVAPDSDEASALAERHRASIERHYDCSHDFHRGLADMYLADPRFTQHYEDLEPGLAQWVHDAIHANADRHA